jgi:hypothetical protein
VRELAAQEDRVSITELKLGEVLAHGPKDPGNGSWPHRAIRSTLERLNSPDVERGLIIERQNMRGVYSKALYEGGDQERVLAEEARSWARDAAGFPRTRAILTRIADGWDAQASAEDTRAKQDKLRS